MSRTRRVIVAGLATLALSITTAPIASASPSPPTNGGNGAGHSGQCTGNPDFRPAVCPGT